MTAQETLIVEAVATRREESELFLSGLRQTAIWLERAKGPVPRMSLRLSTDLRPKTEEAPADVTFVSFIAEATRGGDFAALADAWRRQVSAFMAKTDRPLFLCTVFRHVGPAGRASHRAAVEQLERIRRINLMIADISHSTGACVIDFDGVMAHLGGANLQTDFTLQGRWGAAAAGDVIASGMLTEGLEGRLPTGTLAQAWKLHGGRRGIIYRLNDAVFGRGSLGAA